MKNCYFLKRFSIIFILLLASFYKKANAQTCTFTIGNDTAICQGESVVLTAPVNSDSHYIVTYLWSNGATSQSITVNQAGTYSVTINKIPRELVLNGNFSNGNNSFSSSYTVANLSNTYQFGPLQPEGLYYVGNNPNTYHSNFGNFSDHTGGNGNMMIINGFRDTVTVWCQSVQVQPNTTYDFSTWLANAEASNVAQLQFTINGVPLGNVFTNNQAVGIWSQFSTTWNSGTNTVANICITNKNTAQSGNDFALDDISFRPRPCTANDAINITVNPLPTITATTPVKICKSGVANITASGASTYVWTGPGLAVGGTNGALLSTQPNVSSIYTVTGKDINGRKNTATAQVLVSNVTLGVAIVDANCNGGTGTLTPNANDGFVPYVFTVNNQPVAATYPAGQYTVQVTDASNCKSSLIVDIIQPTPINLTVTPTNILCNGGTNGSISANATGGSGALTYSINNGAFSATKDWTALSAGNYVITVKDTKNCTKSTTINII